MKYSGACTLAAKAMESQDLIPFSLPIYTPTELKQWGTPSTKQEETLDNGKLNKNRCPLNLAFHNIQTVDSCYACSYVLKSLPKHQISNY